MEIKKETLTLAKSKGFKPNMKTNTMSCGIDSFEDLDEKEVLQFELQKWIRETHNLHPYVVPFGDIECSYHFAGLRHVLKSSTENYYFFLKERDKWGSSGKFKTFEDALEYGLVEALTIINRGQFKT